MIRPFALATILAALAYGSAAPAQQSNPPNPTPMQSGGTMSQKSDPSTSKKTATRSGQRAQGSKLDSIASGLNACQMMAENERQACIDRVIRDNGG